MTRFLKPRATAAIAIVPVTVTDRTAPAVLGLEPRAYRDLLVRLGVRHVVHGRRIIATVADVVAALERASVNNLASHEPHADEDEDDEPGDVGALLARLGRARVSRTA